MQSGQTLSREEIQQKVVSVMIELFELEAEQLTSDALLYEELDIDSIDAVDLMVELKNFTGKKMSPEDFKTVRTLGDIVDSVEALVAEA